MLDQVIGNVRCDGLPNIGPGARQFQFVRSIFDDE